MPTFTVYNMQVFCSHCIIVILFHLSTYILKSSKTFIFLSTISYRSDCLLSFRLEKCIIKYIKSLALQMRICVRIVSLQNWPVGNQNIFINLRGMNIMMMN